MPVNPEWSEKRVQTSSCLASFAFSIYDLSVCGIPLADDYGVNLIATISTNDFCTVLPHWLYQRVIDL